MALSGVIKHQHDVSTVTLSDGTGTPITLAMRLLQGGVSLSGVVGGLREAVPYTNRGALVGLRKGAPVFPTGSFSVMITDFSETGTGTILDWMSKKSGTPFASRVSTTVAGGDLDTSDIIFVMEGTTYGDGADHTLTMEDCHLTLDFSEGDPNTCTVNFTCYGDIKTNTTAAFVSPR